MCHLALCDYIKQFSFPACEGIITNTSTLHDLHLTHLAAIKRKKFTPREIDIIACLVYGLADSIPSFLSISLKTMETHIHNIMLKLECNSREGIIDFIEQSEKLPFVKTHYQSLVIDVLFENSLKEIATVTQQQSISCTLWYEANASAQHMATIHKLIKHIKISGMETLLRRKKEDESFHVDASAPYAKSSPHHCSISILTQEEYTAEHSINHITACEDHIFIRLDRTLDENLQHQKIKTTFHESPTYYACVFTLLQEIHPTCDIEKIINNFNTQHALLYSKITLPNGYEAYINAEKETSNNRHKKSNLPKTRNRLSRLFNYKSTHVFLFALTVFGILFLFSGHKENSYDDVIYHRKYIRPDLHLPVESVLLGRANLMRKIKDHLSHHAGKKKMISVVGLVGFAGSGKTTLAHAYTKTLSNPIVWEINAETHTSISDSFRNLACALAQTKESKYELSCIEQIQNTDERDKKIMSFVEVHLQRRPNWLLIYDNVESFTTLEHFFPHDAERFGSGKIIITTRDMSAGSSHYINEDSIIRVDALTPGEALSLFSKITYNTESYVFTREKEQKIMSFLSHIPHYPLDICIASYYIRNSDITCEDYLERMQNNDKEFNSTQSAFLENSTNDTKKRYNIITLSVKKILDAEPELKNLLLLLSLIAAEDIPKALFEAYKDSVLIDRFVHTLKKHAFITSNILPIHDGVITFSIHHSIQNIMRAYLCGMINNNEKYEITHEFMNLAQQLQENYSLNSQMSTISISRHINELIRNSETMGCADIHKNF